MTLIPHGTVSGYRYHKCRCDGCTAASTLRLKEWRDSNTLDGVIHGLSSTYSNYGCRCDECKRARADYMADYRQRNPDKARDYYNSRKDWINSIKMESGCVDCGYSKNPAALDFDHIKGKKLFNISEMSMHTVESILAEMEKCEVVCANCHRIRTFERTVSEKNPD